MLVISGNALGIGTGGCTGLFQSRNRDACHFRLLIRRRAWRFISLFQSRNRDACHFRGERVLEVSVKPSFNLVIEMLVISGWSYSPIRAPK